jgi:hypothetical protein
LAVNGLASKYPTFGWSAVLRAMMDIVRGVTATLEMALGAAGLDKARVFHRPRLLSDNGS